jgi:hypothetical protein
MLVRGLRPLPIGADRLEVGASPVSRCYREPQKKGVQALACTPFIDRLSAYCGLAATVVVLVVFSSINATAF